MLFRSLGQSKLKVSSLGLGCWGMSGAYGKGDRKESIATIHSAIDMGINFIDTADVYGRGHNEELLAKAIEGKRQDIILATKFGYVVDQDGSMNVRCDPDYIREACHSSLKRLRTDYIDLYYMHRLDKNVPVEESVGAISRLVDEGKVRYIGLSEVSATTLARGNDIHPISALQSEYSLFTRDVEEKVLEACRQLDIALVAFSPLARGMLTGAYRNKEDLEENDFRHNQPRFSDENLPVNLRLVDRIEELAGEHGCTPGQMGLSWLLHRGSDIIPIPGMKNRNHLRENIESVYIELTENEINELNDISSGIRGRRNSLSSARFVDDD